MRDSNPRHPACKAGALNQLSYSPGCQLRACTKPRPRAWSVPCCGSPELQRNAEWQEDAVAQHEQHSGRRRVAGVQNCVTGDQREDGRCEKQKIAARQERPSRRRGNPGCGHSGGGYYGDSARSSSGGAVSSSGGRVHPSSSAARRGRSALRRTLPSAITSVAMTAHRPPAAIQETNP